MLCEVGKRVPHLLRGFLREQAGEIFKTMRHYAIGKLAISGSKTWLISNKGKEFILQIS